MIKKNFTLGLAFAFMMFATIGANAQNYKNSVIENIHTRASVRTFSEKSVNKETLVELVKAGMAAPTAGNRQPWEFIVIQDKETLTKLGENKSILKGATAAIVVAGKTNTQNGGSQMWFLDCSAASQNILLAAHSLELGAVWLSVYLNPKMENAVKEAVSLPNDIVPLNVIAIGYPKTEPKPKQKWNESKIHFEKW